MDLRAAEKKAHKETARAQAVEAWEALRALAIFAANSIHLSELRTETDELCARLEKQIYKLE